MSFFDNLKNMATKKKKTITKPDVKKKAVVESAPKEAPAPTLDLSKTLKDVEVFYREKNFTSAKELCAKALVEYPKSFEALHLYGLVAFQLGEIETAIVYVKKALVMDDKHALAYFNLANILRTQQKLDEAVENYTKAIDNKLHHAQVEYMLGVTLQELNRLPEALKHFEKAVEMQADFVDAKNRKDLITQTLAQ
jgi:tetratricopeptide (TPR) repeat protein